MAEYTPTTEEITRERAGALLAAAVQGVAWALIEYETDTSDRGVSDEHYRDAVQRAQAILPTLLPPVVTEEPEWEYGYRLVGDDGNVYKTGFAYYDPAEPFERAKMRADEENEVREETGEPRLTPELIRRRKAGPWVPVEQGDET